MKKGKTLTLTTQQFAKGIELLLKAHGCIDEQKTKLDYISLGNQSWHDHKMIGGDFSIISFPELGGSEGIYLDVRLEGRDMCAGVPEGNQTVYLGCCKSLETDEQTMRALGELGGSITYWGSQLAAACMYALEAESKAVLWTPGCEVDRYTVPHPCPEHQLKRFMGAFDWRKVEGLTIFDTLGAVCLNSFYEGAVLRNLYKIYRDGTASPVERESDIINGEDFLYAVAKAETMKPFVEARTKKHPYDGEKVIRQETPRGALLAMANRDGLGVRVELLKPDGKTELVAAVEYKKEDSLKGVGDEDFLPKERFGMKYYTVNAGFVSKAWTKGAMDVCRMVYHTGYLPSFLDTCEKAEPRPWERNDQVLKVETPHGTLCVYPEGDREYPNISIDLLRADGGIARLAMVEHIPGGEGLSGYDPRHPEKAVEERAEVPESRKMKGEYGDIVVSPGLVTRVWPNEREDEEYHIRIFVEGDPNDGEKAQACGACPLGGDITNDCAYCAYAGDYHFVDGECVSRDADANAKSAG